MPTINTPPPAARTLPAGGATGDVLGLTAAGGLGWQTPPGAAPWIPVTGRWYDTRGQSANHNGALVMTAGNTVLVPLFMPTALPITMIGSYLTAAVAGTAYYQVWTADPVTGMPAEYVGGASTSSSVQVNTVACVLTVPAGWVWIGLGTSAAPTVAAVGAVGTRPVRTVPDGVTPSTTTPGLASVYASGGGGNLSSVTTANPAVTAAAGNAQSPVVWLRAA